MVKGREQWIAFPCMHSKLGQSIPEEVLERVRLGGVVTLFRDLIKVISCGDGRGEGAAVEDFDGGVTATSELEGNGAAPCSSTYDEDIAARRQHGGRPALRHRE